MGILDSWSNWDIALDSITTSTTEMPQDDMILIN